MNSSGHGKEGRGSGHKNSKAWKEGTGGGEVRLGLRGWVVRVEDMADVVGWGELTGLADGEGIGLVGSWFREKGEGWEADAEGVVLADRHEVRSIARRWGQVVREVFEEGRVRGEVSGLGQEADPSVGCHSITKVGAAEDVCLVCPIGRAVAGRGGEKGLTASAGATRCAHCKLWEVDKAAMEWRAQRSQELAREGSEWVQVQSSRPVKS